MYQAVIAVLALLVGYLYAAARLTVWCPAWLKRFVLGEKQHTHESLY